MAFVSQDHQCIYIFFNNICIVYLTIFEIPNERFQKLSKYEHVYIWRAYHNKTLIFNICIYLRSLYKKLLSKISSKASFKSSLKTFFKALEDESINNKPKAWKYFHCVYTRNAYACVQGSRLNISRNLF